MKGTMRITPFLLLAVATALAQAPPEQPKPGPEVRRLRYFVGDWRSEGELKTSPFGPAGKFTGTDHNVMLGDFFVVLHSDARGPMGPMKEIAVMGYDPEEKVYTFHAFSSRGEHETSKGTVKGDTWTWTSESKMKGKTIHGRFTIKELTPRSYTFSEEISTDGGPSTSILEGKATKLK